MEMAHKIVDIVGGAALYLVPAIGCWRILSVRTNQNPKP